MENPPEKQLPSGSDVDEVKSVVSGYLSQAMITLRREAEMPPDFQPVSFDLQLPRLSFFHPEDEPYVFEVEPRGFFEAATKDAPY